MYRNVYQDREGEYYGMLTFPDKALALRVGLDSPHYVETVPFPPTANLTECTTALSTTQEEQA